MKHLRKILAGFLAVAMIVTSMTSIALAEASNPGPHVSASASESLVQVGEEFTLTFATTAMKVSSFTGGISYDNTMVEYVSHSPETPTLTPKEGEAVSVVCSNSVDNSNVGLYYEGTAEKEFEAAEELVEVTFRALKTGNAVFTLFENSDGTDEYEGDGISGATVEIEQLESIAITTQPTYTQYHVGDTFQTEGMVVTATYTSRTEVVEDYTVDKEDPLTTNDTVVTVSYGEKTATQQISVSGHSFDTSTHVCTETRYNGDSCDVEEGCIKLTVGEEQYTIYECEIKAADSVTAAEEEAEGVTGPWVKNAKTPRNYIGTFYSLSSILTNKGIDISSCHGVITTASDGFTNGFSQEDLASVYIYDMGEVFEVGGEAAGVKGTFGTAINGGAGNKWANDVVSAETTDECVMFFKGGECKHYCAICGEAEPSITLQVGEEQYTIYECEIKAADSVTAAEEEAEGVTGPWVKNTQTPKNYIGTFYSLSSILTNKGIDISSCHGVITTASDGFTNGFSQEDLASVYIYDMGEVFEVGGEAAGVKGTFGTAINGGAGNKWANDVVSAEAVDECVMFFKGGKCKHYCAICGEAEALAEEPEWIASEDYTTFTATLKYDCGAEYKTVTATKTGEEVTKAATCTEAGETTYTLTAVIEDENYSGTIVRKGYPAATETHSYGETEYTWSEDGKTCTAKHTCTTQGCGKEETATAKVTSEVKTPATCKVKGTTKYTATFTEEWATTQTKDVQNIALIAHSYGTPTWKWSSTHKTAIAYFTCKVCGNVEKVKGKITKTTTAATCTKAGKTTYVATATFEGKTYTSPKEYVVIPATGHTYVDHLCSCGAYDLSAPKLTSATPSSTGITVKWKKVSGATSYVVYRRTAGSSKFYKQGTTKNLYYKDTKAQKGVKYTYTVRCLNKSGKVVSSYDKTGVTTIILAAPKITSGKAYSTCNKIVWSKVAGATRYRIYRKAKGGKLESLGTTSATSYKDKNAKDGVKYTYYVKAYTKIGTEIVYGDTSKITITSK